LADFGEDRLLVAIPLHRMIGVMSALDHGGGRHTEKSESVEQEIHQMGVVAPGAKQ
jgi:hypothetical protein